MEDLNIEQVDEMTGDDVMYWLSNRFMSPDLIAEKVRYWATRIVEATRAAALSEAADIVGDHLDCDCGDPTCETSRAISAVVARLHGPRLAIEAIR